MRSRKRGVAPRLLQQARVHGVPARRARHQDQVGSRPDRPLGGRRDPGPRQHRGGLEAVGDDHAPEAEPPPQQARDDRARLRGDPARVQCRVARVREHHERHALGDRGAERARGRAATGPLTVAGPSSVFTVAAPEAREVLGGGGHAAVAHPPHRRAGARGDPALVARERARGHDGAGARHVRHRREVHVHAGVREPAPGRARASRRTSAGAPWNGCPAPARRARRPGCRRPPGRP